MKIALYKNPEFATLAKLDEKLKIDKLKPEGPNFSINPLSNDKNVEE